MEHGSSFLDPSSSGNWAGRQQTFKPQAVKEQEHSQNVPSKREPPFWVSNAIFVTTLGNLASKEQNVIRKQLSMGGKTRKQKEMEVLEIDFPFESVIFSSNF